MGRISEFLSRRQRFDPEGHVVSGRLAEFRLMKLTRAVGGDALVLEGTRIPDPEEGGRREIDMVIATKDEILFVEQKHWSGSFTITEEGRFSNKGKTVERCSTKTSLLGLRVKEKFYVRFMRKGLERLRPQAVLFWFSQTRI